MSTVNLPAVIAAHKRRKAENSLNILTVVLSKARFSWLWLLGQGRWIS